MGLIGNSKINLTDVYTKIYGIEFDQRDSKKHIRIRVEHYYTKEESEPYLDSEYLVDLNDIKRIKKLDAEVAVDDKKITEQLRMSYPKDTPSEFKLRVKNEIAKAVMKKQKELANEEKNKIFANFKKQQNVYEFAYKYLKKYIREYKNSKDS